VSIDLRQFFSAALQPSCKFGLSSFSEKVENHWFMQELQACRDRGCQIAHFMANFERFGHILTALAMKKRISAFCEILLFFGHFFGLSL